MQLAVQKTESLSKRLDSLITDIERSAKLAKLVSMNASVIAVRSRSSTTEAYAFEAVASQIMEISDASLGSIQGLRDILSEMESLSSIINKAGRQRMLSQRYMKLALLAQQNGDPTSTLTRDMTAMRNLFENSLQELQRSPLNTDAISHQLNHIQSIWKTFTHALDQNQFDDAATENETLLQESNHAVQLYEALVRKR